MNKLCNNKFRSNMKKLVPNKLINLYRSFTKYSLLRRWLTYNKSDSSEYWKKRAKKPGQARVLWKNEEYNKLYRNLQSDIVNEVISIMKIDQNKPFYALDIGCGIGVVSKMIVDNYPNAIIDAVDFSEMIRVAKIENPSDSINYIESSAEKYLNLDKKYQFIISSACFSAIRDIKKMETAMGNVTEMIDKRGIILMIDPFHTWNYLVGSRVKYGSRQVIRFMKAHDFQLIIKSGVLFWPYRERFANSSLKAEYLKRKFVRGEKLLSILGKHLFADYKILAFRKAELEYDS